MAAVARVFRGCRFLMSPAAAAAGGTKRPVAAAARAKATKADRTKRTTNSGITKPLPISDAFRRFAGVDEVSRAGAIKLIWDHIKDKKLQNPANKREIICDEKLKTILGKDKVGMLEVSKLINPHFIKK